MSDELKFLALTAGLWTIFIGWRQKFSLLWCYAAVGLICENSAELLKSCELNYRLPGNLFVLAELLFISFYYRDKIFPTKGMYYVMSITFAVGFAAHTIYNGIFQMNFIGLGVLCTVYIGFGIVGYLKLLKDSTITFLSNSPFFWINTAFFIYATSCCILFLFLTYLKETSYDLLISIWMWFFFAINILRYIFIGIGLYKTRKGET